MVQCKKCKLFMSTTKEETVKCSGKCESVFHKKCAAKIKSIQLNGLCEVCSKDSPGGTKTPLGKIEVDVKEVSAEVLLKEMNNKLEIIYKMERNLEDLKESVDFYAEKYQKMMEFKEDAEKKIKSLEQKNIYLEKCNLALEERVVDLEMKDKQMNIEIIGLEKQEEEDTKETVKKLALNLNLNPKDILDAQRVGREKPENSKPQPVIVTLKSKTSRDQWLKSRKNRVSNHDLYGNSSTKIIFINEDLPSCKRQLFWCAKNELKSYYKYIWIQNSNILARKENDPKIYRIRREQDVYSLKKQ
ncbi:hypothetical protein O0L34_g18579 [Tuta absoluta]|nr:hypothetical protein O0L34_g17874 [Tuta absoluta]KAJ2937798.1 hypothetical protein O0L34_g18579 [Tuta absoluta]